MANVRMKSLKDKHLAEEAERKAEALEKADEVEKAKILKENKS